eukprot:4784389-Prymnesium_polylepis.1
MAGMQNSSSSSSSNLKVLTHNETQRSRWRYLCCVMHSQHNGDCVLTIKLTESGRPNKHNTADTRIRGLVQIMVYGLTLG